MTVVVAIHALACTLLVVWGLHRAWQLVDVARRARSKAPAPLSRTPHVTVQLPLYNERTVCARAVDAVCAQRYPRDALSVQILDDSTDETGAIVAERIAHWRARGVSVEHVRRADRAGFKAGALAHGLARAEGELIAVFDADFAPDDDFLARIVPSFDDASIAMVQARWEHENRAANALTRAQAACLDAHFTVEHAGRSARGRFFNFNGTAGVWRRSAIERAGGWDARTLTEDLDLSLRAYLDGARFVYRDDVAARAELPADVNAFLGQQHRWAKGSMQTARLLLPEVWRSPRSLVEKVDLTLKLTQNVAFLWLAVVACTLPFVAQESAGRPALSLTVAETLALVGATVPVVLHLLWSARARGRSIASAIVDVPLAFALGAALSIPNAFAVVAGLLDVGDRTFHRTPKRGAAGAAPYAMRASVVVVVSLALAVLHAGTAALTLARGEVRFAPVLLAFGAGLSWLSIGALGEVLSRRAALSIDRATSRA